MMHWVRENAVQHIMRSMEVFYGENRGGGEGTWSISSVDGCHLATLYNHTQSISTCHKDGTVCVCNRLIS